MARHRDPTARLRSLTVGRSTDPRSAALTPVAGKHARPTLDAVPAPHSSPVLGWVPDWVRDDPLSFEPDPSAAEPQPAAAGPDPAAATEPDPAAATEPDPAAATGEPAMQVGQVRPDPGPPPAAGWMTTEAAEDPVGPPSPLPGVDEPVRLPSRWHRLRERWVPEQLHDVRVDPGRRGLLLLSLVSAVSALVAALGVWLGGPGPAAVQPVSSGTTIVDAPSSTSAVAAVSTPATDVPADVVVSVTGAVHRPGLVTLPAGARVADAIAAAGGPLDGTDLTGMNLAARLSDGDSVVVGGPGSTVQAAGGSEPATGGGALIDLNTADQATLETLPGVGPVMAGNIISWRVSNGPFTSVDQLQDVTGIGPSRFATLAPLVTV